MPRELQAGWCQPRVLGWEIRNYAIYNSWELLRSWMQKTKLVLISCRIKKRHGNPWARPGLLDWWPPLILIQLLCTKPPGCHCDTPCSLGCPTCANRILPSTVRQETKSSQLQIELIPLPLSISGISILLTKHYTLCHLFGLLTEEEIGSTFRQSPNDETQMCPCSYSWLHLNLCFRTRPSL